MANEKLGSADLLPVDKAIPPNDDIAPVIWPKWRLDKRPLANSSNQLLQKFKADVSDLVRWYCPWVQVVVVIGQNAAAVSGFLQTGEEWIVSSHRRRLGGPVSNGG